MSRKVTIDNHSWQTDKLPARDSLSAQSTHMRIIDFIASGICLLFLSPLLLIMAPLIKLSSSGPLFYSQERVGLNGRLFRLYKFRSMVLNADKIGTSVTAQSDPRITKIGRFMRKTKLDELPQLWNVIKGDMSLVGPRPDVPEIINNYTPDMKRILSVNPGITGNATLHFYNEEGLLSIADDPDSAYGEIILPAKIKLSMEHVYNKSLWFNFEILLKTLWLLTLGKIWPLKTHPVLMEIKEQILEKNERKETCYNCGKIPADYPADIS